MKCIFCNGTGWDGKCPKCDGTGEDPPPPRFYVPSPAPTKTVVEWVPKQAEMQYRKLSEELSRSSALLELLANCCNFSHTDSFIQALSASDLYTENQLHKMFNPDFGSPEVRDYVEQRLRLSPRDRRKLHVTATSHPHLFPRYRPGMAAPGAWAGEAHPFPSSLRSRAENEFRRRILYRTPSADERALYEEFCSVFLPEKAAAGPYIFENDERCWSGTWAIKPFPKTLAWLRKKAGVLKRQIDQLERDRKKLWDTCRQEKVVRM